MALVYLGCFINAHTGLLCWWWGWMGWLDGKAEGGGFVNDPLDFLDSPEA